MIRAKVCGITTVEDALLAVDVGAAAIGLIFWPSSPRCVGIERAQDIVAALPPLVGAIGVFVNQVDEAAHVAREVGLGTVQFHGDEPAESYAAFPVRVIKAIAVRDRTALGLAAAVPAEATILLDAHDPIRRGGTGAGIDWSIAAQIARERRVILSGGLNAANVVQAIDAVRPYAVDVSSGVESAPGRKDPAKLAAFFEALLGHADNRVASGFSGTHHKARE
jgi:phosphoribosylanthranilate isomerase